jgi:hypothetical protein
METDRRMAINVCALRGEQLSYARPKGNFLSRAKLFSQFCMIHTLIWMEGVFERSELDDYRTHNPRVLIKTFLNRRTFHNNFVASSRNGGDRSSHCLIIRGRVGGVVVLRAQ